MRLQFVRRWNERKRQQREEKVSSKEKPGKGKSTAVQDFTLALDCLKSADDRKEGRREED